MQHAMMQPRYSPCGTARASTISHHGAPPDHNRLLSPKQGVVDKTALAGPRLLVVRDLRRPQSVEWMPAICSVEGGAWKRLVVAGRDLCTKYLALKTDKKGGRGGSLLFVTDSARVRYSEGLDSPVASGDIQHTDAGGLHREIDAWLLLRPSRSRLMSGSLKQPGRRSKDDNAKRMIFQGCQEKSAVFPRSGSPLLRQHLHNHVHNGTGGGL